MEKVTVQDIDTGSLTEVEVEEFETTEDAFQRKMEQIEEEVAESNS